MKLFLRLFLTLFILAMPLHALDLDATFNGSGLVRLAPGDGFAEGYAMAVQSDGKIVAVGNAVDGGRRVFAVVRRNADGSVDSGFANNGTRLLPLGTGDAFATALAVQGDGKIIVAGRASMGTNRDFALARLTSTGQLDASLGNGGSVLLPVGAGDDFAFGLALQSDGKILLAGYADNGVNRDFAVVRCLGDGVLDSTFAGSGKLLIPMGPGSDYARAIAVQGDGKIVMAGYAGNGANFDGAVLRLTSSGSLDAKFSNGGKLLVPLSSGDDYFHALALRGDGSLLLAGSAHAESNSDFAVVALHSDGSPDDSFANHGSFVFPVGTGHDFVHAMAVQGDGKIVLAGSSFNGTNYDFALARLTANGAPDSSFDRDGMLSLPVDDGDDIAVGVAVQTDGRIVAAGWAHAASKLTSNLFLARLQASDPTLAVISPKTNNEGSAAAPGGAIFTVALSSPCAQIVMVNFATSDGATNGAQAGTDYVSKQGTLTFAAGETKKTVTVNFIGDAIAEASEKFFLDISASVIATIASSRAVAYIRNDDGPDITISNAKTVDEGNVGESSQTYTVALSAASTDTVTVAYATANGSAGPADFVAQSGTLTFAPGEITRTISIQVIGDTAVESNEKYFVKLSSPTFAVIAVNQAAGYIRNDDTAAIAATVEEASR